MEILFWYDLQKKVNVFLCKSWVPFFKSSKIGRRFAQIFNRSKLLGVCLHPPPPTPLERKGHAGFRGPFF